MKLKSLFRKSSVQKPEQPDVADWVPRELGVPCYLGDSLCTWNKNMSWLNDPRFKRAYEKGMDSGHHIGRPKGSKDDIHIEWRLHTCCWAALHGTHLEGDFVECGVNTGIMSLAVCDYIDFNNTGKEFFLFDTFLGIPEVQMNQLEKDSGRANENKELYGDCYETALRNFSPYPKARLIRGMVPDTLTSVQIEKVCYLSIDMNIVYPELAALEYFWDRLVSGAMVILDDYGWAGYYLQQQAMDKFTARFGIKPLTLPTGQGLIIKP